MNTSEEIVAVSKPERTQREWQGSSIARFTCAVTEERALKVGQAIDQQQRIVVVQIVRSFPRFETEDKAKNQSRHDDVAKTEQRESTLLLHAIKQRCHDCEYPLVALSLTSERRFCLARKGAERDIARSSTAWQWSSAKGQMKAFPVSRFLSTYRILRFSSGNANHDIRCEDVLREVHPEDIVDNKADQQQRRDFQVRQPNESDERYAQACGDD